ncbi:hypothetical protein K3495_g962 [Podosphaera aphanis]|nr:hypothetical protein K3495_g962 [Podosphaera aphanis]
MQVDDFKVLGPNLNKIEILMQALHKKYKLKSVSTDLFLAIHIIYPRKAILLLSQGQYVRALIDRHGLKYCKPATSRLERLMLSNDQESSPDKTTKYNSIIGGLQFLADNTRLDIAFAVNHLARFLIGPSEEHLKAAHRVLRYLSKETDRGFTFRKSAGKPTLEVYTDADSTADLSTSRSSSGSLILLSSGLISWRSHLQCEVVLSTTEAEYLAATKTCGQLQWTNSLLQKLKISDRIEGGYCTRLLVDNQLAISFIKNHDNHRKSKHISLRNFYCREQHQKGLIEAHYVTSANQLADSLTKVKSTVAIQ